MILSIKLNQLLELPDYSHVDLTVESSSLSEISTAVRFKLFADGANIGLEFRDAEDWPQVFRAWPGKTSDRFGRYFRVINTDVDPAYAQDTDSDIAALMRKIGPNLVPIIKRLVEDNQKALAGSAGRLESHAQTLADFLGLTFPGDGKTIDIAIATAPAAADSPASAKETAKPQLKSSAATARAAAKVPDYVRTVMHEFRSVPLEVVKLSNRPMPDCWSPLTISVVKNELDRLYDFLRHYRSAGVERFLFIDNGSTDGTVEFLASQPDVDLYMRRGRFDWMLKQGWINKLISVYGYGRWYMYLDADEHIVFDGIGERSFRDLVLQMEKRGIARVRGLLIDMYSGGPLLESSYVSGAKLIDSYPFFDTDSYVEDRFEQVMSVKGGPRRRVFGAVDARKFDPELTKYPLFKIKQGEFMANPHHIWPYDGNFISDRVLGILHFKFLPSILNLIRKAIEERNYWNDSVEYRCYLTSLEKDPKLSLMYGGSERLLEFGDLLAHKVIAPVNWEQKTPANSAFRNAFLRNRAALDCSDGLSEFRVATAK